MRLHRLMSSELNASATPLAACSFLPTPSSFRRLPRQQHAGTSIDPHRGHRAAGGHRWPIREQSNRFWAAPVPSARPSRITPEAALRRSIGVRELMRVGTRG